MNGTGKGLIVCTTYIPLKIYSQLLGTCLSHNTPVSLPYCSGATSFRRSDRLTKFLP